MLARLLLLGTLMTAPLIPQASTQTDSSIFVPGETGLSPAWLRYLESPFVRDTMAAVFRGAEPIRLNSFLYPPQNQPGLRGGVTNRGNVQLFERPNDDLFTHEMGHMIERRLLAPEVTDSVRTLYENLRPRAFTYQSGTGDLPAEYVGETFRMAMRLLRASQDAKAAQREEREEKRYPGIRLWLNWLRSRLSPAVSTRSGE